MATVIIRQVYTGVQTFQKHYLSQVECQSDIHLTHVFSDLPKPVVTNTDTVLNVIHYSIKVKIWNIIKGSNTYSKITTKVCDQ